MHYVSYEVQNILWSKEIYTENVTDEMRNTLIKEVVNDKRDLHDNLDKPTIVAVIPGVITTTIGGVQYKNLIKMATHSPND